MCGVVRWFIFAILSYSSCFGFKNKPPLFLLVALILQNINKLNKQTIKMASKKEVINTAIKLVGEMWRSKAFDSVPVEAIAFEAIRMALLLKKELKEQTKQP